VTAAIIDQIRRRRWLRWVSRSLRDAGHDGRHRENAPVVPNLDNKSGGMAGFVGASFSASCAVVDGRAASRHERSTIIR
jgi:hypothetical protein